MTFYVGQKVVCVEDRYFSSCKGEMIPKKGEVLTVRSVSLERGILALRFVEIVNAPVEYADGYIECKFFSERFRPLLEKGMKILQDIAAHPERELEDA